MKNKFFITIGMLLLLIYIGCNNNPGNTGGSGTISLSLTDAPIADASDVEGVFITIESISYNLNDEWITASNFEGPQKFNLLELTGGSVAPLADTEISAGEVTQIRFMLSASEKGSATSTDPGCYIAIDPDGVTDGDATDDVIHELFVPSGGETGYKANGSFTVPTNGTVEITADFDVRKSVVYAGNINQGDGFYLLKPTIRLIVNNQAGKISGTFTDNSTDDYTNYTIFVYEAGEYSESELSPTNEQTPQFANAVSSIMASDSDQDGTLDSYTLAFLAAGTYDLIVAGIGNDETYEVVDQTHTAIVVTSETTTTENIDLN